MNRTKIEEAVEEKDLWIWVDTSLKATKQCEYAAKTFYIRPNSTDILSMEKIPPHTAVQNVCTTEA